jgi:hypothetical protein
LEPSSLGGASAIRANGLWIASVTERTAVFTLFVALGGAGGRVCAFGLALVAARCRGGADAFETTTGRALVVEVGWKDDVVELLETLLVLTDELETVARATGAGSGPSLDGALTGGFSGAGP